MSQNVPATEKLTANQERAIVALLSSPSLSAAAEAAGINRRTLSRWLKEEEFSVAYRSARREVMEYAVAQVQHHCSTAVETLRAVCEGEVTTGATPRVQAARAIVDLAMRGGELEDMWANLKDLERPLN